MIDVFSKLNGNQLVNLSIASFGVGATFLVVGLRELHRVK
jgi:hypothetical protein